MFLLCSNNVMSDRPASWRMPTRKEMEKLAASPGAIGSIRPARRPVGPADEMPPEYWQAILDDAGSVTSHPSQSIWTAQLSKIPQHLLRVSCKRCGRIVEIQKADAVRLYGPQAIWKNTAQRLLDATCTQRTGRYEE